MSKGKQQAALTILPPATQQLKKRGSTGLLQHLIIPDTVAFKAGDAAFPVWYLSSKSEPGTIKRRNHANVSFPLEATRANPRALAAAPFYEEPLPTLWSDLLT